MARGSAGTKPDSEGSSRFRVYWQSDTGLEHGLIRREITGESYEVYSYRTGELLKLHSKQIQKRIQEFS